MTGAAAAVLMIAQRDLLKLLRDRARLVSELIFPFVFIGALGGSLQANLGPSLGIDLVAYTFTGVYAMTVFQTTALGLVSLIEDRENDFSQEIFVSPVSRYTIVFGKIIGETLVASPVAIGIVIFAAVLGVPLDAQRIAVLVVTGIAAAVFGGAFGLVIMANLRTQRAANQIFPFVLLPQYFLAGIFNPITVLPWYLEILSRISPLRYAVDLVRAGFYAGSADGPKVVLDGAVADAAIMAGAFVVFMGIGTAMFVRSERTR